MKTILFISFTNVASDPRVRRHVNFLREDYRLFVAGYGRIDLPGVESIEIKQHKKGFIEKVKSAIMLLFGFYEKFYWGQKHVVDSIMKTNNLKVDAIIANDVDTLPLALKIKGNAKVILDAHEYWPRHFEDRLVFRIFSQGYNTYLSRKYIVHADKVITVCDGIAEQYGKDFGIQRPEVVVNSAEYREELKPFYNDGSARIKLIHHGGASPSRKITEMIKMMGFLKDEHELYLMLVDNDPSYLRKLKRFARNYENVLFIPPLSFDKIVPEINKYDIGVYLLPPVNFNYRYILPNKLYEFIQARLAIAIGPSEEMSKIVKTYDLGVVAKEFSPVSMAQAIRNMDREKISLYKKKADNSAFLLSSEQNREKMLQLIKRILTV